MFGEVLKISKALFPTEFELLTKTNRVLCLLCLLTENFGSPHQVAG